MTRKRNLEKAWRWLRTVFCVMCLLITDAASAVVPAKPIVTVIGAFTRNARALPDEEIVRLERIAREAGGTKTVGKILGEQQLPDVVLEDTYLRIIVQQQRIARHEADGMYQRLSGTPGFRTTLRKTVGSSDVKTAGHLNELRIADAAVQHRFTVKGIGEPFDDGVKTVATDIDVLLEKNGHVVAIEAKDYASTTPIPMDSFRADMVTLTRYAENESRQPVLAVFSLTNLPKNPNALRMLQLEAERRGLQMIIGDPYSQIVQIQQLLEIL